MRGDQLVYVFARDVKVDDYVQVDGGVLDDEPRTYRVHEITRYPFSASIQIHLEHFAGASIFRGEGSRVAIEAMT